MAAQLDSKAELRQAETGVPAARGEIAALDAALALTRGQLAALSGQGQDAGVMIARPHLAPARPPGVPADIPAALLGRRPELVALRWQVEAASGGIDVARAQFYPAVNPSVSGGLVSLGFDRLVQGGSRTFATGPLVTLPLLDGGRLRSNLAARNAGYDLAVAQYNGAVLEEHAVPAPGRAAQPALSAGPRHLQRLLRDARDGNTLLPQVVHKGVGVGLEQAGELQGIGVLAAVIAFFVMLELVKRRPHPTRFFVTGFLMLALLGWRFATLDPRAYAWDAVIFWLGLFGGFLTLGMATTAIHAFKELQADNVVFSNAQQRKNMLGRQASRWAWA